MAERDACGTGFIADLTGRASHDIVRLGIEAVAAMAHRGARSADGKTGDGAGVICDIPRAVLERHLGRHGFNAACVERLAVIGAFLPQALDRASAARTLVEAGARHAGVHPLCWRLPPVGDETLGPHARHTQPRYEQLIVDAGAENASDRMRRARRAIDGALRSVDGAWLVSAAVTSVTYKALLSSESLANYYSDLRDPLFASRYVVFHQRYSTNTAPTWRLVQPFRHIAHNGEINTISGNRAWLRARGRHIVPHSSDSHDLDAVVEMMVDAGYGVDDAVDLLLGCAPDQDDERLKAYYAAHLPTIEHWDGPAALAFADGDVVGAALDRNGFRPLRWCRTENGKVLAASEAGVVDFGDDPIVARGRLGPGDRLVVRFANGQLIGPEAFRAERRECADFRDLVKSWSFTAPSPAVGHAQLVQVASTSQLRRFAYTREDEKDVVGVMASGAGEPVSSMGDDAALTFLVRRQPAAYYLRQRFAQVTNPPIDPLRESLVFDMRAYVGFGKTHGEVPASRSIISLDSAILDEPAFDTLCGDDRVDVHRVSLTLGDRRLVDALRTMCEDASDAVRRGASLIVLDDRSPGPALPAVLAAGALHHQLAQRGLRMHTSIAVADGYARDSHSIAAVLSAGANVVAPWLALRLARVTGSENAFLYAARAGLMKIMAKLGICTLRSYVGAQTFECLGLAREVAETCFPDMAAHLPTVGFADLDEDVRAWYEDSRTEAGPLPDRGLFRYRRDGLRRAFEPTVLKTLRASAMHSDYESYEKLSDAMDAREPIVVRDLIDPSPAGPPLTLNDVMPVDDVVRTFATAAMSFGALGPEAHETVARAANRVGARSNSGEGGEEASRLRRELGNARSAIKQIASGRFGVSVTYLESADEIEIKMAQGSKPGEGGQIPADKVTSEIARLRGAAKGTPLISPPPHHDIYSIEDLAQLIYDLRRAAPHARIAVKLVAQQGIGLVACGVAKAGADVIHISGHDGGTGASPLASIKYAGLPWELGLSEAHRALEVSGLRGRVSLRSDGGMKSGRDVIVASLLGADEFGFGSALLIALGCVYARQCHKNTCPVGIATQDSELRKKFSGTAEQGMAFFEFVARDVRRRLARLGARSLGEIRGRHDLLRAKRFEIPFLGRVDVSALIEPTPAGERVPEIEPPCPGPHLDDSVVLPWAVLPGAARQSHSAFRITPADRAVGARIAHQYVKRRLAGEPAPSLEIRFRGTAGQSFGAFLTEGIALEVEGDANDYVGKSMDGGRIVVLGHGDPSEPAVGNTCFYGARRGEAYICGTAGERFGVRNSGAILVAEGAGDHACEYMTSGLAVILGAVGRNVASGMSGGVVFIFAESDEALQLGPCDVIASRCSPDDLHLAALERVLRRHAHFAKSDRAARLLEAWPSSAHRFWKLAPLDSRAFLRPDVENPFYGEHVHR